ncbi:MAG TPA: SAM-dependent methyltransferase [Streptosporangiaceae bacterium]|nr:SAM-dependent methyltransferase [Streptosporangiaceae bacterium]
MTTPNAGGRGPDPRPDPPIPHPARVYNCWLGGKDHYPADRKAAEDVIRYRPQVVAGARQNRYFLARAVRYLAGRGIRQFLDIGSGLPAPGNTHEIAQDVDPRARIVYADNDPLVVAHARAALTTTPGGACACIQADLRDPAVILDQAAATLDLTAPVAVLLLAVLHFLSDAEDPAGTIAALANGLAPGSYLAITHLTADFALASVTSGVSAYNNAVPLWITARSHAQVTALLGGRPLVPPGVVPVTGWRPGPGNPFNEPADLYAGIARTTTQRQGRRAA